MEVKLSSIFGCILSLAFTILIIKFLNWVWFKPRKLENLLRKQGFLGNPYRILLGDMKDFVSLMETEKPKTLKFSDNMPSHILPWYNNIIDKYGKHSFIWFGPFLRINIADPELVKEILNKPDIFQKPSFENIGKLIAGGLAFLEHDAWVPRRKILNPSFHLEKLKKMVPAIFLSCSEMIGEWETLISSNEGKSVEIDVWPYLQDLTGDVISRTAFGSVHAQGKRIFELQREQVKLIFQILRLCFIPGWRYLPTKTNRRLNAISGEIKSLLRGIINQRKKAMENGEIMNNDLLGILIESNANEFKENGNALSIEDVIEECKLFFFAGTETTTDLIAWTMVMLAKHHDWQTRARDEVFQLLEKETPTYDNINQLKIVTMIIYEVLRMFPPAPMTSRAATKAVKLGDKMIPVGAQMSLLIGNMHYDAHIWGDDANEFKPDRFSQGISCAMKTQFAFLPFGAGPRVCIGQNLATIEAKLALVMMLQTFSFELSPSYRHAPFQIMTLQPQYGVPIILHKL